MERIAVVYATWHGQARDVAQHVADVAALRGFDVDIREVGEMPVRLADCAGLVIVGSVHFGRHSLALTRFARRHRGWLSGHPSAFVSVSGAAISMEGRKTAAAQIQTFLRSAHWDPDMSIALAGGIPYTKYDPMTRWAMKFSARFAGRDTDTSRDYDYTNWFAVDAFTHSFLGAVERFCRLDKAASSA